MRKRYLVKLFDPRQKTKKQRVKLGFFLKVPKKELLKSIIRERKGKSPRLFQFYLGILWWVHSQEGNPRLGMQYFYGRSKGRLCYHKHLKQFISNFTGLQHKQMVRYFRRLEERNIIYRVQADYEDGKRCEHLILNPRAELQHKPGQQFLRLNMKKIGRRGFDIFGYLERELKKDSHPAEKERDYKFKVSRSTRWYRAQKRKYKPKRARKPRKPTGMKFRSRAYFDSLLDKGGIQEMTPIEISNPFLFYRIKTKTTKIYKKIKKFEYNPIPPQRKPTHNYQKRICLKFGNKKRWIDWWKTKKADTDYIKSRAGADPSDKLLWYGGCIFRQVCPVRYPYEYEYLPKRPYKPREAEKQNRGCAVSRSAYRNRSEPIRRSASREIQDVKDREACRARAMKQVETLLGMSYEQYLRKQEERRYDL